MGINSGNGAVEVDDGHKCVQNGGIGETQMRAVVSNFGVGEWWGEDMACGKQET